MTKKALKKDAFTLIELLVVISIIALLLSILMPALSRARKAAHGVVCGNNLRQWGTVCFNFTNDHKGKLPRAFHHEVAGVMPTAINDVVSSKTNQRYDDYVGDKWEEFGVPWDILVQYGMTEDIAICPGQRWLESWTGTSDGLAFLPDGFIDVGGWRRYVYTSYTFLSGMKPNSPVLLNTYHKPLKAYQIHGKTVNRIIAADTVAWADGVWKSTHSTFEMLTINHPGPREGTVALQNLLHADGHVEARGSSYYAYDIREDNVTTMGERSHWDVKHRPDGGPYFYWNGAER